MYKVNSQQSNELTIVKNLFDPKKMDTKNTFLDKLIMRLKSIDK